MSAEFTALICNGTWELVPPNPHHNLIGCKWVFHIKCHPDGAIDRYKALLVAKGFYQRLDIDFFDTFSPVVKPTTIRPPGFIDPNFPGHVCKLRKALYGLKQAPCAWRFSVKDLGSLNSFLDVEVVPTTTGLFLSQHKYIFDLLSKAHMDGAKEVSTPMTTSNSLVLHDGSPPTDATKYRQLVGGLQYLSLTLPNITFCCQQDL
ncbi:PREDICTED: Retrovirus-related Pol poly from [Prunus dulcis]|uniref:PREDICTED: Retrovirus-related Pol poly from n=1 Tax=Prunus dulcis TaxID=3755 RepID=A0A5E4GAG6_PRUDU|nr:PREDICTED: Retrovirus-related Pol poly from [Prunus dulcis]